MNGIICNSLLVGRQTLYTSESDDSIATLRIPMDDDDEIKKFKRLLAGVGVFLVFGWFAVEEMRYTLFGSVADATIIESFETTPSGR